MKLAILCCLLPLASARSIRSTIDEYAARRTARQEAQAAVQPFYNTDRSKFRYLNNQTSEYLVESLPLVPFNISEMYSGLMPIEGNDTSRSLFFVWQPTVGEPVDEITIWLNGGPGCSSLEGFLQENGLYTWKPGTYQPVINPYSFVNLTNVLWVEQPVGVGFSQGVGNYTNQTQSAEDFVKFFGNFQQTFNISNYKVYITGESYAGRYVPYIAYQMIQQNDTKHFNVSGAMAFDPCIGSYDWGNEVSAYQAASSYNNVLGINASYMETLAQMNSKCGYADYLDKYLQFPPPGQQPVKYFNYSSDENCDVLDGIYSAAIAVSPWFNPYQITAYEPILWDVLGDPGFLPVNDTVIYFDRADVKKAMHAPETVSWTECSADPFVSTGKTPEDGTGDSSPDPIQYVLPRVIEHTNRVLISNGDLDLVILTNSTLLSIQNMTWGGQLGFQQKPASDVYVGLPDLQYAAIFNAYDPGADGTQGVVGKFHYERGLMYTETFLSGHMQPQFQPRAAYLYLQWLLGRVDTLGQS